MSSKTTSVILVGAGPIGLVAAHALSKAKIDFILLESRPSAVMYAGANLVLLSTGMRVLAQLGLGDALSKVTTSIGEWGCQDHKGQHITNYHWSLRDKENFGETFKVVSRHDLTKVMYDALPSEVRSRIYPNKKVTDIENTPTGTIVKCADGTSYNGSIVIGADGAHSAVRREMRKVALETGTIDVNDEAPFLTTYRCFWIRFKPNLNVPRGMTSETHGHLIASQLFSGHENGVAGLYERLERPTKERLRYTEEDERQLVEKWGHLPLTGEGNFTLRDAYDTRIESGLVSLEEGVVPHWSHDGRIVLAGDAAHKFTPSTGSGCNNGFLDVVCLANELHKVFQHQEPGSAPDKAQLDAAFKAYQAKRIDRVKAEKGLASNATAMATWETRIHKFIDRWIFASALVQNWLVGQGAKDTANMPVFDFVPAEERFSGNIPWASPLVKA